MRAFLLTAIVLIAIQPGYAQTDNLRISGYVQGMPVWISADLPEPFDTDSFWEFRLQSRLNVRYDIQASHSTGRCVPAFLPATS